jgi:gliding motility-associated-like protein
VLSILFSVTAFAQAPVANFSANIVSGCSPIVVQFTDLSTNTPTSWSWNLGNTNTSTLQNPSTTYITPGVYTVTLTATNSSGSNTKTIVGYITVSALPTVSFTADSSISCSLPRTIVFTNNSVLGSSGTPSYFWDFGDGSTSTSANPTKTYNTYGNFTVTLLVTNGNGCTQSLTKTGYIKNMPKAITSFTSSGANACTAPATVVFTNTTSGAVSYDWNFGDGGTSTATNPSHTYNTTGSFTVRLISTNSGGCKDTLTSTNYVSITKPTASFNTSSATGCTGRNLTMSNTSTPSGYTSAWNFGDGGTSTSNNPSHAYATAGTYSIRLIVTRAGCSDTTYRTVNIGAVPAINYFATPVSGCTTPFTTTFSNSTTGASSYLWSFGDGGTSTSTAPSHTYTSFGAYTVKLVATGTYGCSDSATLINYITVSQPSASIIVGTYSGCAPITISFFANVNTTIPVSNYSWNFGDGSSVVSCSSCGAPTHTYTTAGTYTVTLTYTTGVGCTYTTSTVITVSSKPTASFTASPTTICPGAPVTFTNNSTGTVTAYQWLFGDGGSSMAPNPVYTGYSMGTYTVRLIADNNGCKDTFTRNNYITVNPPNAFFSLATTCANRYAVTVTDGSIGANTYSWNFGDGFTSTQVGGTLTHTYATAGTYNIVLTVTNTSNGCTSSYNRQVTIQPLVASFTVSDTTLCRGVPTLFTAASSSIIVNYYWDLGAGNTYNMTSNNVGDYYTIGGNYTIKLVVTDANGCKDSLIKPNHVHVGPPNVDFTATPTSGCMPLPVTFTDISTPNGGFAIVNRQWTFGNGGTTTTAFNTTSYTYPLSGTYTVKLVVTDANGCKDSLTKNNYITTNKPTANFSTSTTNVCKGQIVSFTNTSTGTSLTYAWNFGDGGTSTLTSPTHAYSTSGTYNVRLIATNGIGCSDTMIRSAYINVAGPSVSFTMSDSVANCPPLVVVCTNTSTGVTSYNWSFANGSFSTLQNASTLYTYPGFYNIKLIGTSSAGCKDSSTRLVRVYGPTGTFTYAPIAGCNPLTVSFSSVASNTALYVWDMGNGYTQNTSSGALTYTYTQTGQYVPKLILSDGASCLVPYQGLDTIKVDYLNADFNFTTSGFLCYSGTVQFTDTVLATLSAVTSRAWTFGDGGTSTAHNPSHNYTAPGTYTVRLIVTNAQGCQDTSFRTVVVNNLPTVTAASNQSICQGTTAGVSITATGANSYVWTPATGLSCTNCSSPTALPAATTTYVVTGTDGNGCTDTGVVTITVNALPNVTASANVSICNGTNTTLNASGASNYSWSPTTGLSCTNCANPIANPTTTTTYIVTGTTASGCSDTGIVTVTVNPKPVVNAGGNRAICLGSSTTITASGANTYAWTPATGLSCTNCASPVATPIINTTYTVIGSTTFGCKDTQQVTVTVNALPTVNATTTKSSICAGTNATLNASGATSYVWTPATSLSCSTCVAPVATPATTTTYTLTGTDGNGCINIATVLVTVNPYPVITASGSATICSGDSAHLNVTGATTYNWSPAGSLSCTACANPTSIPISTTAYTVIGNSNGCLDTDYVTVTVRPLPQVTAGIDREICIGTSVTLEAKGANSYLWSPATGLSCTNCAKSTANPIVSTLYFVTGTDADGCKANSFVRVIVHDLPKVNAGNDTAICDKGSIQFNATGAYTYSWSPGIALSCTNCPNPIVTPASKTTYTVIGTDNIGCSNTDDITVDVIKKAPTNYSKDQEICKGASVTLYADGGTTYQWLPITDNTTLNALTVSPLNNTRYTVIIKQGDCFSDTGYINVIVHDMPEVELGPDKNIGGGSMVSLIAGEDGLTKYEWTPGDYLSCIDCAKPTASPRKTTHYNVKVTNQWGCVAEDDITIRVSCDNSQLFVPNTFTPNNDGNNDYFFPQGKGLSTVKSFRVYNRWGELIFDRQDMKINEPTAGWDGTYKLVPLKPDVFVYIIRGFCESGEPIELKGDISLVR